MADITKEDIVQQPAADNVNTTTNTVDEQRPRKSFFQAALPVFAAGAGLFSDGYVGNVIGSVTTILSRQYDKKDAAGQKIPGQQIYSDSTPAKVLPAIAFAGTVVGQLIFGFASDHWSRSNSLLTSTGILLLFTALATGAYWHGDPVGMFNMLVAWRFFVGIGIGGEYPAGSVASAEATGELKAGTRHRWFILFTNTMIDWGFVLGAFVPYVTAVATDNYDAMWRASLGVGILFPAILFVLRLRLKEPEEFTKESMKRATPYTLVLRYYWFRLTLVSIIWFIYDFTSYAFGIYGPTILGNFFNSKTAPLYIIFGWNVVLNLFYIPGTVIGAFASDWLGPKTALIIGLVLQSVVGFIMAGVYEHLLGSVGGFVVIYGIFQSLGEFGAGNNIGLLASKTCATGVRGRYYGIAAAIGKIGAFVGTYVFPVIIDAAGDDTTKQAQYPFWVSSSLGLFAASLALFIPLVGQDTIHEEDAKFRAYLESHGWDTNQLGEEPKDETGELGTSEHISEKKSL